MLSGQVTRRPPILLPSIRTPTARLLTNKFCCAGAAVARMTAQFSVRQRVSQSKEPAQYQRTTSRSSTSGAAPKPALKQLHLPDENSVGSRIAPAITQQRDQRQRSAQQLGIEQTQGTIIKEAFNKNPPGSDRSQHCIAQQE